MLRRSACCSWLRWLGCAVAFDGNVVGAQPGGYPGFAGGDALAIASAVGAFGQALAELLDFADVGFAFVGAGGDGETGRRRWWRPG
jgi:hypothetical protein